MSAWNDYLEYLDESPYSVQLLSSNLAPKRQSPVIERLRITDLDYTLWPFQQKILEEMENSTLIVGLPTGLGKTYLAGAKLCKDSQNNPLRVLFLVPSIPLGVQQTLFARQKLKTDACFVSGQIPPQERNRLQVWNRSFVVTTPQTFFNDHLTPYQSLLDQARDQDNPVQHLSGNLPCFPYDTVIADECQRYIGKTAGYSILLAAKASGSSILALSATPQMHAPKRLQELKKIFQEIKTFSLEEPEIKKRMPSRLLIMERIRTPELLLKVYHTLGKLSRTYSHRIKNKHGSHNPYCTEHPLCRARLAIKMLKFRMIEDGASSVINYKTWRFKDLQTPRNDLDQKSIHQLYQEALNRIFNHKLSAAVLVLEQQHYHKAIVYVESVVAAKQLGDMLHKKYGQDHVAVLVGKGSMTMDQQASALLQFREEAKILVCTSVGEEGLDIPAANIEVWVDPPSNPKKWIQRFGRILRQPGDKKVAKTIALVSMQTHEKRRLLSVKKKTEKTYGFTQQLKTKIHKSRSQGQTPLTKFTS
ncbi:MAG: helicase-related protein [Thermoproteota archaeon]